MFLNVTSGLTYYGLGFWTLLIALTWDSFIMGVMPAAIPFSLCMIESFPELWSAMTLVGWLLPVVSSTAPSSLLPIVSGTFLPYSLLPVVSGTAPSTPCSTGKAATSTFHSTRSRRANPTFHSSRPGSDRQLPRLDMNYPEETEYLLQKDVQSNSPLSRFNRSQKKKWIRDPNTDVYEKAGPITPIQNPEYGMT